MHSLRALKIYRTATRTRSVATKLTNWNVSWEQWIATDHVVEFSNFVMNLLLTFFNVIGPLTRKVAIRCSNLPGSSCRNVRAMDCTFDKDFSRLFPIFDFYSKISKKQSRRVFLFFFARKKDGHNNQGLQKIGVPYVVLAYYTGVFRRSDPVEERNVIP